MSSIISIKACIHNMNGGYWGSLSPLRRASETSLASRSWLVWGPSEIKHMLLLSSSTVSLDTGPVLGINNLGIFEIISWCLLKGPVLAIYIYIILNTFFFFYWGMSCQVIRYCIHKKWLIKRCKHLYFFRVYFFLIILSLLSIL